MPAPNEGVFASERFTTVSAAVGPFWALYWAPTVPYTVLLTYGLDPGRCSHDPDTAWPPRPSTASTSSGDGQQLKIFINYRRDDAAAHARLLYERLADRFGDENVFLDVVTMKPGDRWLDEIRSQSSTAGVFLALIGRRWAELITERAEGSEDHVRSEIEAALREPHSPSSRRCSTEPRCRETQVPPR